MISYVNQLSLYGAIADMIQELSEDQVAPGGLASEQTGTGTSYPTFLLQKYHSMTRDRETSCKITSKDLKDYQKTRNYPMYPPKQVWIWWKLDNSSMLLHHRKNRRSDLYAENMHYFEKTKRKIVQKCGSEATNDSGLSWRLRFAKQLEDIARRRRSFGETRCKG